jgi:ACS family sodium-dependent inorganic phosphate cotransporter
MLATRPEVASDAARGSAIITIGLGLSALTLGGVSANHLDVAPRHAGVVFAAGNTAATFAGFLSVPLTGILLDRTDSWALVFGLAAAHHALGALAWVAWSGGEVLEEDITLA